MTKGLKGHLMSRRNKVSTVSVSGMNMDEVVNVARGLCVRKPHVILITCGTNSMFSHPRTTGDGTKIAVEPLSPAQVCQKLRELVTVLESEFPATKVVISQLILRTDVDGASEKINEVNTLIAQSNIAHVDQSSITSAHLNGSKLHLNQSGDKKLAVNFIEFLRAFLDD